MRKTTLVLFLIFLLISLYCYRQQQAVPEQPPAPLPSLAGEATKLNTAPPLTTSPEAVKPETYTVRIGEEIVYNIQYGLIAIGTSRFNCLKRSRIDGAEADVISFKTEVPRFEDTETVYSDPENYLPFRVERDILKWPFREKITEVYDQKNFVVDIIKGNSTKITIRKERPIHNAILLPYFIRRMDNLDVGWSMTVTFPTQEFLVTLVSMEDLEVPAGKFKTYHFQSQPKKFEIWITADERKIPVKIQGLGIFGYALLMKEYK